MVTMSTALLKSIALLLMLIDHIGAHIPQAPVWFRYIGRVSLPLFFYCSAWGFHYTHDRKKYLLRLYGMSVFTAVGNVLLLYFGDGGSYDFMGNIFTTIFMGCLIVYIWESAADWKKRIKYFLVFAVHQIVTFIICCLLTELWLVRYDFQKHYMYGSILGNSFFTEGSILFVLYFVCVYFLRKKRLALSLYTILFSFCTFILVTREWVYWRGTLLYLLPFSDYQWLMVLVIPFYFLYNGKKGRGAKYFYYWFYPLHTWALYAIGLFLGKYV